MTAEAGEFAGLDRFEARKRVIAKLEEQGRLVKTEPHVYNLGYCQRCDTIIEPYLSAQWFVKIQPLADPAIAAVEKGDVRFVPRVLDEDVLPLDARTSTTGASRGSSGGATASPRSRARTATSRCPTRIRRPAASAARRS